MFRSLCDHHQAFLRIKSRPKHVASHAIKYDVFDVSCFIILILNLNTSGCLQSKSCLCLQRVGSVRGEDVPYVLGLPLVGGQPFFPHNYTHQDASVSRLLIHYLANFARKGCVFLFCSQRALWGTSLALCPFPHHSPHKQNLLIQVQ